MRGALPGEEVLVASYRSPSTLRATAAAYSIPERSDAPAPDAGKLRAQATRYRELAATLHDPRVIAEVQSCARELESEAACIEKQSAFGARIVIYRYRIGG
jgi:hypothetical protein